MADFAMPQALELETARKNAIPAIRRQIYHDTTTQNVYRPGELCYIPVETGTAGAFMDTSCTRLEMKITVRNKNYFTDFINLPRCGWNAIIQEFGIEINNGLHEQNRHYAECVELDMIKSGENKHPFEMTRSNPYKVGNGEAGVFHINFVKPSMVTNMGLPHNVKYPVLSTPTANTTPDFISDGALWQSNPFIHESFGLAGSYNRGDVAVNVPNQLSTNNFPGYAYSSMELPQSFWDDRIARTIDKMSTTRRSYYYQDSAPQFSTGTTIGKDTNHLSRYRIYGIPTGTQTVGTYSKMRATIFEAVGVKNIFNVTAGTSVDSSSPAQWPVKQPCPWHLLQALYKADVRLVNANNIQNYYANCKNIPVGIPLDITGKNSGYKEIWGDSVHTVPTPAGFAEVGAETEFHVSLKIYSSLIGELSRKWFPECVTPAGRMRIRIRFQEPNILFQTLMDPCRRVPGTSRDWFPYLGMVQTKTFNESTPTADPDVKDISAINECAPQYIASGIHIAMISNYIAGDVFNSSVAMGKYTIPQMRMKGMHTIRKVFDANVIATSAGNTPGQIVAGGITNVNIPEMSAAIGSASVTEWENYLRSILNGVNDGNDVAKFGNLLGKFLYELKANQEYGYPSRNVTFTNGMATSENGIGPEPSGLMQIKNYQEFVFPQDWRNVREKNELASGQNLMYSTVYDAGDEGDIPITNSNPNWDADYRSLNWNPFCTPTPQYVPMGQPWDKRSTRTIDASVTEQYFIPENQSCFGTHLEHSVAQVRRSHSALYPLNIQRTIESRIDERLTYIVSDIRLVTQQIILPQTAADSIIQAALQGGISIMSSAWKEMESILPKASVQKHLINMAAAFCNDITFLFRPTETYQGDRAYGYNSFSFYNPFTCFRFDFDSTLTPAPTTRSQDYNDLGGKPVYYNEMVISNRIPIDVQLQLQAELLPRTPIDTLNQLLMHTRWGDQVFGTQDYMDLNPRFQPSYQTQKGMVVNTLQDGYYACFVPISALDDQTITCNPFFTPLEFSIQSRIRGSRAPINALPFYKPFDGTFHLSFNLETFMGQNGRMITGVPVVNNNMFLRMDNAHMVREYDTQLLTVASCDSRAVWERGGTFQFFT